MPPEHPASTPICSTVWLVTPSRPAKIAAKDPSGDLAQLTEGTVNDVAAYRIAHVLHATSAYPDQLSDLSAALNGATRGRWVAGRWTPGW